jgi:hypothetical protein
MATRETPRTRTTTMTKDENDTDDDTDGEEQGHDWEEGDDSEGIATTWKGRHDQNKIGSGGGDESMTTMAHEEGVRDRDSTVRRGR